MPDVVDAKTRSRMMSGIRGKDTKPETIVRSGLHRAGFRFRLHDKNLPGRPDLVLPKYGAVIFVHGCFWHGHDCHLFKWPKSREGFWREKIEGNQRRDEIAIERLRSLGWRTLVIWECALKGRTRIIESALIAKIGDWLQSNSREAEICGYIPSET